MTSRSSHPGEILADFSFFRRPTGSGTVRRACSRKPSPGPRALHALPEARRSCRRSQQRGPARVARARARSSAALELQQFADLGKCEARRLRRADELEPPDVLLAIAADLARRPCRLRQQAAPLIVAHRFDTHADGFREGSDRVRTFRLIPYHGTDAIEVIARSRARGVMTMKKTNEKTAAPEKHAAAAAIPAPARTAAAERKGAASVCDAAPLLSRPNALSAHLNPDHRTHPASRDRLIAQAHAGNFPTVALQATARVQRPARRRPLYSHPGVRRCKRTSKSRRRSGWFIEHSRIARCRVTPGRLIDRHSRP